MIRAMRRALIAVRSSVRCSWHRDESFANALGFLVVWPEVDEPASDASDAELDCCFCCPLGVILRRFLMCGDLGSADRICGATHDASDMGTS